MVFKGKVDGKGYSSVMSCSHILCLPRDIAESKQLNTYYPNRIVHMQ